MLTERNLKDIFLLLWRKPFPYEWRSFIKLKWHHASFWKVGDTCIRTGEHRSTPLAPQHMEIWKSSPSPWWSFCEAMSFTSHMSAKVRGSWRNSVEVLKLQSTNFMCSYTRVHQVRGSEEGWHWEKPIGRQSTKQSVMLQCMFHGLQWCARPCAEFGPSEAVMHKSPSAPAFALVERILTWPPQDEWEA